MLGRPLGLTRTLVDACRVCLRFGDRECPWRPLNPDTWPEMPDLCNYISLECHLSHKMLGYRQHTDFQMAFSLADRMLVELAFARYPNLRDITELGTSVGVSSLYLSLMARVRGGTFVLAHLAFGCPCAHFFYPSDWCIAIFLLFLSRHVTHVRYQSTASRGSRGGQWLVWHTRTSSVIDAFTLCLSHWAYKRLNIWSCRLDNAEFFEANILQGGGHPQVIASVKRPNNVRFQHQMVCVSVCVSVCVCVCVCV
jgi:hypothetical protein